MKLTCRRCQTSFEIKKEEFEFLKNKAEEKKNEFIMPKLCDRCRTLKKTIKSIPIKIQQLCNVLLEDTTLTSEVKNNLRVIFGLASKEMKQNMVAFGFIERNK